MKSVSYEKMVATIEHLCIQSCYELPGDVLAATKKAIKDETASCHIASLLVAVNIECHSHRYKLAVL